jgi:hypothetical protein
MRRSPDKGSSLFYGGFIFMIIILILIVCAVLSYILYRHVEKTDSMGLEISLGCICLLCIVGICIGIPWCVIAWSPSINDIEKSKVDAQREANAQGLRLAFL